jgi:hypothetical protein
MNDVVQNVQTALSHQDKEANLLDRMTERDLHLGTVRAVELLVKMGLLHWYSACCE